MVSLFFDYAMSGKTISIDKKMMKVPRIDK